MIILGKIKVDDQVFKYCEISYDPFYVTVMSENEKAIVDLFNSAKSIIVMDQYGLVIKSITNYCGVESSTVKYDFYCDNDNTMKPVINIKLKAVDLNAKIKSIEDAMNGDVTDESNSHGYDQAYRWNEKGDYDCSSAVYTAWVNAGIPVKDYSFKTYGCAYTGVMKAVFTHFKFKDVTSKVNLATGAGLQRGDILLNENRHVAMYCGNGLEVEASINENGRATGGKPGDQTGREFLIRSYRNYPWNVVLRYTEAADGNPPVTTKNYLAMGDKGDAVKTMQTMLIKLGYSCGKYGADGDFGSGSLASVKAFQRDNGLVADGLYGEATKAKLTTLYNAKIKAESAPKPSSKPSIASSSKVASAQSFNKSIAGTYKVKASNGLNLRYKPGDTSNSNLIITIPNGKSVANYGYYTTVNGVKWYLVTYKDTPGFVSSRYLVK